jgi:H+-translocating NAD(P) transhydrogenase subunit alpha
MTIGILKEPTFENRVSLLPDAVAAITKKGIEVIAEQGAGDRAYASDADYEKAGAQIKTRAEVLSAATILLALNPPEAIPPASAIMVGVYQPLFNAILMKQWADAGITSFSLDMLPRTTRAQSMDILSSQANIAGYKAVVNAAAVYPRYFPMLMTAAGSITPAKVLILGAGVAGLQAIATAKRLGAVVEVFDTRPAVKEEVQSLGAKFIEVDGAADASKAGGYAVEQTEEYKQKQQQKIAESIAKADIVITTAQIPGKKAPILIPVEMVTAMKKGSLIMDLAAATGGNCALTKNNETVEHSGVRIIACASLPGEMPADASKMYGKNVWNFLQLIIDKENKLNLNFADDLVKGSCITHNKAVEHERVQSLL